MRPLAPSRAIRSSRPPPSGSGCTAGNRVAAGSAETYRTIPAAGPGVALTFDMGGRMEPAVDIMNFLVDNGICTTIFATGVMSQTAQGAGGDGDHPGASRAVRDREPHDVPLRPGPRWWGFAHDRALRRWPVQRGPRSPGADRCGGDPERRHRPGPAALLAAAVRLDQRCRHQRRGCRRLHQDLHVGHRHDRLEADQRRRTHRRTDRRRR